MELESELEHLEAELERMKMYETSYHTQEKNLQAQLDRVDLLQNDKRNLEVAHQDLITDFNMLKKDFETA